jgi:hypothetical protein
MVTVPGSAAPNLIPTFLKLKYEDLFKMKNKNIKIKIKNSILVLQ